jgi:hypothetical protein
MKLDCTTEADEIENLVQPNWLARGASEERVAAARARISTGQPMQPHATAKVWGRMPGRECKARQDLGRGPYCAVALPLAPRLPAGGSLS